MVKNIGNDRNFGPWIKILGTIEISFEMFFHSSKMEFRTKNFWSQILAPSHYLDFSIGFFKEKISTMSANCYVFQFFENKNTLKKLLKHYENGP